MGNTFTTTTISLGQGTAVHDLYKQVADWLPKNAPVRGFIHTVNRIVDEIRTRGFWTFWLTEARFSTTAPHTTGTVAVTNASTTVTGTDTVWTSAMAGRRIRINGGEEYLIGSVDTGAQTLTLTIAYKGTTDTAGTYTIYEPNYTLASDCEKVMRLWDLTDEEELLCVDAGFVHQRRALTTFRGWTQFVTNLGRDFSYVPKIVIEPYPDESHQISYLYYRVPSKVTSIDDNVDVPSHLDPTLVQGIYAAIQRQNKASDWQSEYLSFKEMLDAAWMRDQPIMGQIYRVGRQDLADMGIISEETYVTSDRIVELS